MQKRLYLLLGIIFVVNCKSVSTEQPSSDVEAFSYGSKAVSVFITTDKPWDSAANPGDTKLLIYSCMTSSNYESCVQKPLKKSEMSIVSFKAQLASKLKPKVKPATDPYWQNNDLIPDRMEALIESVLGKPLPPIDVAVAKIMRNLFEMLQSPELDVVDSLDLKSVFEPFHVEVATLLELDLEQKGDDDESELELVSRFEVNDMQCIYSVNEEPKNGFLHCSNGTRTCRYSWDSANKMDILIVDKTNFEYKYTTISGERKTKSSPYHNLKIYETSNKRYSDAELVKTIETNLKSECKSKDLTVMISETYTQTELDSQCFIVQGDLNTQGASELIGIKINCPNDNWAKVFWSAKKDKTTISCTWQPLIGHPKPRLPDFAGDIRAFYGEVKDTMTAYCQKAAELEREERYR